LEAKARFEGTEREVNLRVASLDGKIYLDFVDKEWRAVEIDANGWRVIDSPPVRFRRTAGMLRLPEPAHGGSINAIRRFLNVKSETDFILVIAWILAVLSPNGPYPVLALSGEQGSAKSTFSRILKSLLDPNSAPIRSLPQDDRNFFISANNGFVLAFDNVSALKPWSSDSICRLATGGGFAARQLYTDQDEVLFTATRPQILNGIEEFVTRPDLADRALILTLEAIPEEQRRSEADLWAEFEVEHPKLLGALLDAVAHGLQNLPNISLPKLPRMADFALWATACETAFWASGTFWTAYSDNVDDAVDAVLDADPVATALRSVMSTITEWSGTASALKGVLTAEAGDAITRTNDWPKSPRALSGRLRRAAPLLRKAGIKIEFEKDKTRKRTRKIIITNSSAGGAPEKEAETSSKPSELSETRPGAAISETRSLDAKQAVDDQSGSKSATGAASVRSNSLKQNEMDDVDDVDVKIPGESDASTTSAGWRARL
jgi:hypothetical protein